MAATKAMIDYAKAISEKLNIDEPDFSDFNETSSSISENSVKFKKLISNERIVNQLEDMYGLFDRDFTDDFKELLERLYGLQVIYIFWSVDEIAYIGKSINLQARVYSSLKEKVKSGEITHISILYIEREADMHIMEVVLITEYKPTLNLDCACKDYSKYFRSPADLYSIKKIQIFKEEEEE